MSDIDDRLRSYAERWRAAQPAPPPLPALRPARRWVPVTAVAAAVAAILAVAAVVVRQERQDVTTPTVVPWKAIPQGYYSKAPLPRDCRPPDVAIRADLRGPGPRVTGQAVFRNTSAEPCALRDVAMDLRSGGSVPLDAVSVPGVGRGPSVLPPGGEAQAAIEWTEPYCGKQLDSVVLFVRLAGSEPVRVPVEWNRRAPNCTGEPRRSLFRHGPPIGGTDKPASALTARVEAPATVRSGDVLRYRIVVENPTDRAQPLDPCPRYAHGLAPAGAEEAPNDRLGRLHCEAAPATVGPRGAVAFEMELWLGTLAEGPYELWSFVTLGAGDHRVPVTVRGRTERRAQPCGADAYVLSGARAELDTGLVTGGAEIFNASDRPCDPAGLRVALVTRDGRKLAEPVDSSPREDVVLPGDEMVAKLTWYSHCGAHTYELFFELTGPSGRVVAPADKADTPSCRAGRTPAATVEWLDR